MATIDEPKRRKKTLPKPAAPGEVTTKPETAPGFDPRVLDSTVIAMPLIKELADENPAPNSTDDDPRIGEWTPDRQWKTHNVIIDVNLQYSGGREAARKRVRSRSEVRGGWRAG